MKRRTSLFILLASLLPVLPAFSGGDATPTPTAESGGKIKLQAQLIWGTDEESTDPKLKPIDPKVAKKLEGMAVKWKHYYLVNEKEFTVAKGAKEKIEMSKECLLVVKNVDGTNVEVQTIGKMGSAGKVTKAMGKGKCLVTGGNATNKTADRKSVV